MAKKIKQRETAKYSANTLFKTFYPQSEKNIFPQLVQTKDGILRYNCIQSCANINIVFFFCFSDLAGIFRWRI